MDEKKDFLQVRTQKVKELRENSINPYANDFKALHTTQQVTESFKGKEKEEIETCEDIFSIAGRVISVRSFGKAAFLHIQDRKGLIQAYIQKNKVGTESYDIFKKVDIGDFIGIKGSVFLTKSDELTILAVSFTFLTKTLRPLPEKWHGLHDIETRY